MGDIKPVLKLTKGEGAWSTKLTLTTEDGEKDLGVIPFSAATFRIGEDTMVGGTLTLEIPGCLVRAEIEEFLRSCKIEVVRASHETLGSIEESQAR